MDQKQQVADIVKNATNILVTVSSNPSVDQLASCIGLSLALNKMGKHATAVFSGKAPSTIEFLEPEKTFEGNIDSLRDFIISLDKTKADKLRYKVEDSVVKIFITPYHTTLSDKDLEFSQGDFNVDSVVSLGVIAQQDIDQAISAHGRILHDAAVITLNNAPGGDFGSIHWMDQQASSLCEMVSELLIVMDRKAIDGQIATALLTGIVAETQRFSNSKTTPVTMSASATLMAAGANQQLVVTKLDQSMSGSSSAQPSVQETAPGEIQIRQADNNPGQSDEHTVPIGGGAAPAAAPTLPTSPPLAPTAFTPPKPPEPPKQDDDAKPLSSLEDLTKSSAGQEEKEPGLARIRIDDQGSLHTVEGAEAEARADGTTDPTIHMGGSRMILQPPSMGTGSSGLVGDGYRDPLTPPAPLGSAVTEQPSGAPAAPPAPLIPPAPVDPNPLPSASTPFAPPPPAAADPAPSPLMPPSTSPGGPISSPFASPSPAPLVAASAPPSPPFGSGQPSGPGIDAIHPDTARNAVTQAFAGVPAPPDLAASVAASTPPAPIGPPPPVPPPMLPTPPQ